MSLLLEALKKAEKAKEEAQRRSSDGAPATELSLHDNRGADASKPVMTRTQLPDISQPLEILTDDLAPAGRKPAVPPVEPAARGVPPPGTGAAANTRPQAGARPSAASSADASLQRAAARKVFEVKFKESNPRMPFYITMGVLGVFAVSTAAYFWYQLRPPPAFVNANPTHPVTERAVVVTPVAPPSGGTTGQIAGLPGAGVIPGLPGGAPTTGPSTAPGPRAPEQNAAPKPAPRTEPPSRPPLVSRAPAPAVAALATPEAPAPRPPLQVHPKVQSGYAAYSAGDLARARDDYQDALRDDPNNRDALLGLAALDTRSGRLEAAEGSYLRLLQVDPRDAHAQAGLLALRAGRIDPLAAESRVKTLLAADPAAHVLNFALGNQLARQERWAEAQQQYFKAFAADPENADFAFNLAVSLDHLRQPKLALQYYERALALAAMRGANFDTLATRSRIAQLAK